MTPFLEILVVLLVAGVLVWAAQTVLAAMPWIAEPFRTIIYVLIVVFAVLWLLEIFGLLPASLGVPRLR